MDTLDTVRLNARDASGQRRVVLKSVRTDSTVEELVWGLMRRLGLPEKDSTGMPQAFHAFHERSGRHLLPSQTIGESLVNDDELILHPDVQAGARRRR